MEKEKQSAAEAAAADKSKKKPAGKAVKTAKAGTAANPAKSAKPAKTAAKSPDQAALQAQAAEIVERLKVVYPDSMCALEWGGQIHGTPLEDKLKGSWKLLIMGRLSAQCTDARVNIVCRDLFARFPTPEAIADCDLAELESIIRPCGLFHTKADNIKAACRILVDDYGGIVPDDMDALLALPGVGRKIANLLLGDIYHRPVVVTDTHCIRICGRLGFYEESLKDPLKVEKILVKIIEPCEQSDFCHRIVQFGRDVCIARAPQCPQCPLRDICRHGKEQENG